MSVPWADLDPGIRDVVRLLVSKGFTATDSGDGVSKIGTEQEHGMIKDAHVVIPCSPPSMVSDAEHLTRPLRGEGVDVGPDQATVEVLVDIQAEGPAFGDGVYVEATYTPDSGSALISVRGLDDATLQRCQARAAL